MKFDRATDVWSFGIVMLEIYTFGDRPYTAMSNKDVIQKVPKGFRPARPTRCPIALYKNAMRKCWDADPKARPGFSSLVSTIDELRDALSNRAGDEDNSDDEYTTVNRHGYADLGIVGPTSRFTVPALNIPIIPAPPGKPAAGLTPKPLSQTSLQHAPPLTSTVGVVPGQKQPRINQ